jgi:UDP-N-acetylbacillosamine N-acetyltransferase
LNSINGILFYGFGGHARSVADVAFSIGVRDIIFVDDNARPGEVFSGFPVIKHFPSSLAQGWIAFPASGDSQRRRQQLDDIQQRGWKTGNVISGSATLGVLSQIGQACFIGHHSHVGPGAVVGDACIINTGAIIEHDCTIGSYSHISVNSTIAGKTTIGNSCFIGAGATVIDNIKVSDGVTLGAGSCAIKHILHPGIYVGTPARKLKKD